MTTLAAMALHPESPKGGHINAPQVTDSLVHRVCDHNGLGCQVLWRMAQLVPHVPLRRRTWLDQSKMSSVADFVLTGDQKFAASSCGVSIGIIGISAIDVVNSYWAGHVGFSLKVGLDVYLEHSGPVLSDETRQALQAAISKSLSADNAQRLEELLAAEIPRWREGFASGLREGRGVDELHPLPDTSPEENFMRFTGFGIVNSHSVVGDDTGPYPKVSGAQRFKVNRETKMLVAEWCIESKWYNQPTLHYFPFDSHEMCAIFWTQTWPQLRISQFGRSYGLGTFLQEFEVLGFRGDPKPVPGWDPYVCESNIVPNLGRPAGEYMVYARFWIRRKPFYFIASLLFPTAVVTAMGGFAIMVAAGASPNSIVIGGESPLSLVAGLILTMMAMQFSYADSLPKLGYLTMLDIYILSSFCLLSFAACIITLLPAESLLDSRMSLVFFTVCLAFNAIWAAVGFKECHIPEEKKPQLTFANAAVE